MKNLDKKIYEAPNVEVYDVKVESGFAQTGGNSIERFYSNEEEGY